MSHSTGVLSGLLAAIVFTGTAFRLIGEPPVIDPASSTNDSELVHTKAPQSDQKALSDIVLPEASIELPGMPGARPYRMALEGHARLRAEGRLDNPRYLTLVDFSLPSTEKRMWVMDLEREEVVFHTYAAHGVASGVTKPTQFSDIPESHQSSLGFYLAAEAYTGKHGLSLRLDGLESGVNGRARERAIVLHGAEYAEAAFIQQHGRLGRSQGCPSVPRAMSRPIIDAIQGNSCLFIYAEDQGYLAKTSVLSNWQDFEHSLASL
jgi:hypothetical protein